MFDWLLLMTPVFVEARWFGRRDELVLEIVEGLVGGKCVGRGEVLVSVDVLLGQILRLLEHGVLALDVVLGLKDHRVVGRRVVVDMLELW